MPYFRLTKPYVAPLKMRTYPIKKVRSCKSSVIKSIPSNYIRLFHIYIPIHIQPQWTFVVTKLNWPKPWPWSFFLFIETFILISTLMQNHSTGQQCTTFLSETVTNFVQSPYQRILMRRPLILTPKIGYKACSRQNATLLYFFVDT